MTPGIRVFDKYGRDITDNFDDDGVLKDKHSMHVPLMFRDSAGNVTDADGI
jgi:hypothetical protein